MTIYLKDLVETYKKTMIIDFENESVMFIHNGNLRGYSKKYFNELIKSIDFDKLKQFE
jgi:hypothetical protein